MRLSFAACLFVLVAACSAQAPGIEASDAYIVEPVGSRGVTLGGLEITATGEDAFILSASSPMAERIEIHTTLTSQTGRSQMRRLDRLMIEAGRTITLGRGGVHLMVFGFDPALIPGDEVDLVLHYQQGDAKQMETVTARITALGEDVRSHTSHGS